MPDRQIETFEIEIPRAMAYRLLGIRRGARPPRPSALAMIDAAFAEAKDLVDARAVLGFSHGGLPGSDRFPAAVPLVAVVCTIGPALEARVSEFAARGESARAAVLDAVGSAAAEEVAAASNRLIRQLAAPTDLVPRPRRSPGYGAWDIREQRALFDFLAPDDIGVTLTEQCMMVPRKSVSYVVRLDGSTARHGRAGRDAAAVALALGSREGNAPADLGGDMMRDVESNPCHPCDPCDPCDACDDPDCPYREPRIAASSGIPDDWSLVR